LKLLSTGEADRCIFIIGTTPRSKNPPPPKKNERGLYSACVCAKYTELNIVQEDVKKKSGKQEIRNVHSSPVIVVVKLERTKLESAQLSPKIGEVHTNVWTENFKATGLLKRLRVHRKEILKLIFEEQSVTLWTGQTRHKTEFCV